MPSKSQSQRKLMAMAEHNPEKVYAKNKGVLKMTKTQLHDFIKKVSKSKSKGVK